MTIKSFAVVAAIAALPFGASVSWSQSQMLTDSVSSEAVSPAAKGNVEYLNFSKNLKCEEGLTICSTLVKGKKGYQTLITYVTCASSALEAETFYGSLQEESSDAILAIFPVASRAQSGENEVVAIAGPAQVFLGPNDKATLRVWRSASGPATTGCNVTGTLTKL